MTRCDIKILQRRLGVSDKRKMLNRPHITFALTTVKKAGATFLQSYYPQDYFGEQFDSMQSKK